MSHIWMSHVTHMNGSRRTYRWVMSHIWMSHVTRMNESCRTCRTYLCRKTYPRTNFLVSRGGCLLHYVSFLRGGHTGKWRPWQSCRTYLCRKTYPRTSCYLISRWPGKCVSMCVYVCICVSLCVCALVGMCVGIHRETTRHSFLLLLHHLSPPPP